MIILFRIDHMAQTRELFYAHLYPILASFSVVYFAIQIAPLAEHTRVKGVGAVVFCKGARFADTVILEL